ncbi:hypothetical protein Pan241w_24090 [Gimesia alba]|uniref:Uncharacterized protein n=1 Tax=Gimesia alba TaxID=2527973 RepID=A0A517REM0_9PLAN|nr:hypothetical protein Pan241w_24090 [Gimesia alba]
MRDVLGEWDAISAQPYYNRRWFPKHYNSYQPINWWVCSDRSPYFQHDRLKCDVNGGISAHNAHLLNF